MISKWLSFIILSQAVQAIVIPKDPNEGPPVATFYRPPVYPAVPIRIGERRALKSCKIKLNTIFVSAGCDNHYHGSLLPCLIRPWLPPFSYRVQEADNGEHK